MIKRWSRVSRMQLLQILLYSIIAVILLYNASTSLPPNTAISGRSISAFHKPAAKVPAPAEDDILLLNPAKNAIASDPMFRQNVAACTGRSQQGFTYPDSAGKEAQLNKARYDRCYHQSNRFFFFGNNWGRHFNHVTSVVAALVLSRAANRTLILPVFSLEKKIYTMDDLYNVSKLFDIRSSPYCVLSEYEFHTLELESLKSRSDGNVPVAKGARIDVEAMCVSMRGIKMHPQKPQKFNFNCVNEVFIKYKKNLTLFYETVVLNTRSPAYRARFLTVPLVIYYAEVLPKEMTSCPWSLIQPHGVVRKAVDVFSGLGATIGIHMRSLEGSCKSRVAGFPLEQRLQLEKQCAPTKEYIEEILSRTSAMVRLQDATVIIADDGQNQSMARSLLAQVPRGVRPQDLLEPRTRSPFRYREYFTTLRKGLIATTGHVFPFLMNPQSYASIEGFLVVQVDFWLLALSDVFIGNQMSTLSQNVCRWRLANGNICNNFV